NICTHPSWRHVMTNIGKKLILALTLLLIWSVSASAQGDPTPVHEHLAQFAGEFTTVSKFTMNATDKAMESSGSSKISSVMGGRFLLEESAGMMMGQKFTSVKLTGYNSLSEKFEASWVYTGSTSIMTLTGTSPDGGKTINWEGTFEMQKGQKQTL